MQVIPLSNCVANNLSSDTIDVRWRRCWRDHLGASALPMLARPLGARSLPLAHEALRKLLGGFWRVG